MMGTLFLALVVLAESGGDAPVAPGTGYARPELLVETAELAGRADQLRLIDVRPESAYRQGHIGAAVHFDVARLRTKDGKAFYLPTAPEFARMAGELGIRNDTPLVIYDEGPSARAARLWYVLDHYGHGKAALLNGGWNKWKREGRPVATGESRVTPTRFTPRAAAASLCTADALDRKVRRKDAVILDVRSAEEYNGTAARPGSKGHIPGAVNVEWKENLSDIGTFKPADQLRAVYAKAGITPDKEVVTYCQTGGRASHSLFVLRLLGHPRAANYYGSWEEWANRAGAGPASDHRPASGAGPTLAPGAR
jgi:thiosulfate/3-mercaptopyruvate sulfurtransferase